MTIIIDANVAGSFTSESPNAVELSKRIRENRIIIVTGGKLKIEISKTNLLGLISALRSSGRLKEYDDSEVNKKELYFKNKDIVCSNDPHILALAYVSGCRLLYSDDIDLIKDFKCTQILKPKGSVVKNRTPLKYAVSLYNRHADKT